MHNQLVFHGLMQCMPVSRDSAFVQGTYPGSSKLCVLAYGNFLRREATNSLSDKVHKMSQTIHHKTEGQM